MKREWKPGDVAMVKSISGMGACVAVRTEDNTWRCAHGATVDERVESIRPLAVLDPEDDEQAEKFWRMAGQNFAGFRAALREFANPTPPKPDEPTGLGAVVEDVDGKRYVRCAEGRERWHCPDDDTGASDDFYDSIAAVRVLSEGVTNDA